MRKLKLFFACLLMAVLSIGQVWGADVTYTFSTDAGIAALGITKPDQGAGTSLGSDTYTINPVSMSATDGGTPTRVWNSKGTLDLRIYNNGGSFTFSVSAGYYLTSIEFSGSTTNVFSVATGSTGSFSSDTWTAANTSTTSVKLNATGTGKINTITVNYESTGGGGCEKNVTISKGTPSHGDFTLSKDGAQATCDAAVEVVVTPHPAEHYKASGVTAPNSSSISTPDEDGKYTVTYEQNTNAASEINVNFTLKDQYTVTWDNNGNTSVTTQVYEGEKPVFPATPAACDATSTTFIGWATAAWDGKEANLSGKTVYTSASAMPAVTEDLTYYAVFAKTGAAEAPTDKFSVTLNTASPSAPTGYNLSQATEWKNSTHRQDGSNDPAYVKVYHPTSKLFSTLPTTITIKAGLYGGTARDMTDDGEDYYPYVFFTDNSGNEISGSAIAICTSVSGSSAEKSVNMDVSKAANAYGIGIRHKKISGFNLRYSSLAVSYANVAYTDYMTTCAACTHLVDAPELDGTIAVTHNTATINWKTLTNASSYDVTVIRNSDSESIFSGNVNALTKALTGLDPETQYDYSIMGVGDGSTYCTTGNGVLNGSFTTDAAPTAKLYLVQLKDETPIEEGTHTVGVEFDLPTSAATCGKTLVGWTTDTYENYTHATTAPTVLLKKYTFASTDDVTLYAVYANVEEDDETITPSAVAEGDDPHAITINKSGYTLSANKNTGSTAPAWNSGASDVRIYAAGDITLASTSTMTRIVFNLSAQGKKRLAPITASVGTIATQAANDETVTWTGSATSVTFTVGAAADYGSDGSTKAGQLCFSNIDVTVQGEFSNYSTTCVDAPVATPSTAALNDVAVAGASGTITMTYEHVNASGVAVSLWNNAACTEAFEGSWLTASLDEDKNITYTIAENTSYNDARSAYIRLIAPETSGAASPAVVKIPVSQVKKAAVFASLEELAAADVNANTEVTVSFSDVVIKEIYMYNSNRRGLTFNIQKAGQDIKIYYNADVPSTWVAGGKVSGTLTNCPWKIYSGAWQLAPANWAWSNLTYDAPPAIDHIEIRGSATEKTYVDGQVFNPAGLSVIAIYDNNDEEDVTAYSTWTYDPEKLSEDDTEVEVTAEYNSESDSETVTGLTVNPIPNKTIAQFIAAGGTRCYLEGTVSNYTNTTKGYFDITDASGTLHIYGCTSPSSFTEGDKIKVIAEEYEYYQSTTHEAKNVVYVSKVSAATIDIDDIDDMVVGDEILLSAIEATITPVAAQSATINYAVTEGTAVTIEEGKIKATAEGEATITASIEAGEGYLAGSTTFTVTVGPAPEPFVGDYFVKVANKSDLTAGEYLIVYEDGALAFNGSLTTLDVSNNTIAVTFDHGKIQGTTDVLAATFTVKLAGTIQSASGYYIGQNSDANGLSSSTETQFNNAISIGADGNAVIVSEGGAYLRYNQTSGQERFRYFKSATYTNQQPIALYKKENAAPVYETVRTDLNEGEYYTMCLDKAVTAVQGGTIWRVVSKSDNTAKPGIILEDVAGTLDAGRPYIFRATADKLEVVYNGAAVDDPITEGNNGLVGSFTQEPIAQSNDNYIIYNNALYYVNSDDVYVGAHRAYLDMTGVPAYSGAASAPGRRRVVMTVHGEQTATGMENVQGDNVQCTKVLIDGQMYILRGEKLYDATGRLVK